MLLSLDIIATDLQEYIQSSTIHSSKRNLAGVRIVDCSESRVDNSLLLRETPEGVLCECENGSILFKSKSVFFVCNIIQDRFLYYHNWQIRLAKVVFGGPNWQEAVDTLYIVLKNPLYIVDRYGKMLGLTKQHATEPITPLWLDCAEKEALIGLAFEKMRIFPLGDRAEIVLPNDSTRCNYLQCSLSPQDRYSHVLYTLEWEHELSTRDTHLVDAFQEMIQEANNRYTITPVTEAFAALLSNKTEDVSTLSWSLLQLGWQEKCSFVLMGFTLKSPDDHDFRFEKAHFLKELPAEVMFPHNEFMLILVPTEMKNAVQKVFTLACDTKEYLCGISDSFSDWSSLPERYKEVELAVQCGRTTNTQVMSYVKSGKTLISIAAQGLLRTEAFQHPLVKKLAEHDSKNRTDFLATMYHYLRLERKVSEAASFLCLHRNTLLYRLHAIEHIASYNWDDHFERIYFLLSYEAYMTRDDNEGDDH